MPGELRERLMRRNLGPKTPKPKVEGKESNGEDLEVLPKNNFPKPDPKSKSSDCDTDFFNRKK